MNFTVPSQIPYPLWNSEESSSVELRATHGAALAQLGYTLVLEDCPADAVEALSQALSLRPQSATIREWRATSYLDLGDYEKALADLQDVVALNPHYAGAYNNRGLCYLIMGRNHEALADFNTCIILNPDHVISYHNRTLVLCELKQYWRALQSCDEGLALDASNEALLGTKRRILARLDAQASDAQTPANQ